MDLKSKGIRWVESVCQTFETVCEEVGSTMSQMPTKYIGNPANTVGKGVKKLSSSVIQDLLEVKLGKTDATEASPEESDHTEEYIDSRNVEDKLFYMNGEQPVEVHGAGSGLNQGTSTPVDRQKSDAFFEYEHIESPWVDSDRSLQFESVKGEVTSPFSAKPSSVTNIDKQQKTSNDEFYMNGGSGKAKGINQVNLSFVQSSTTAETQESNGNESDALRNIFDSGMQPVTTQDVLSQVKKSYHSAISKSTSSLKVEKPHSDEYERIESPWGCSDRSSLLESAKGECTMPTNTSEVTIPNGTKPSNATVIDKQHKTSNNEFYMNGEQPVEVHRAVSGLNQGTLSYAQSSTPVERKEAHINKTGAFCNMLDSVMYAVNTKDALSPRAEKSHSDPYPEYEYIETPWDYSDISSALESVKGESMLSVNTSEVAIPNNTKHSCVTILDKQHKTSNDVFSMDGEKAVGLHGAASELNQGTVNYVQPSPSVERHESNINETDLFGNIVDYGMQAVTHDALLSQLNISYHYHSAITKSKSSHRVEKYSDPYYEYENIETPWGDSDRNLPLESAKGEFSMFNNTSEVAIPNSTKPPSVALLENPTNIIVNKPVGMSEQNESFQQANSSKCFTNSSYNYDVDSFRVSKSETLSHSSGSLVEQGWDSSTLESSTAFSDICISDDVSDSEPLAEGFSVDDIKSIQPDMYINRHPHFLSSYRGRSLKSYKKLLQDTLNSKKHLVKEYKQLGIWHGDIYEEHASVETTRSTNSSSQPPTQSISTDVSLNTHKNQNLSDWELL